MSQTELGKASGHSLKYIGNIERGDANLSMDVMESVCAALQLNPFAATVHFRSFAECTTKLEVLNHLKLTIDLIEQSMTRLGQPRPRPRSLRALSRPD